MRGVIYMADLKDAIQEVDMRMQYVVALIDWILVEMTFCPYVLGKLGQKFLTPQNTSSRDGQPMARGFLPTQIS